MNTSSWISIGLIITNNQYNIDNWISLSFLITKNNEDNIQHMERYTSAQNFGSHINCFFFQTSNILVIIIDCLALLIGWDRQLFCIFIPSRSLILRWNVNISVRFISFCCKGTDTINIAIKLIYFEFSPILETLYFLEEIVLRL